MQFFSLLGEYVLLLRKVFSRPERFRVYYQQTIKEMDKLGLQSVGIVVIISLFIGAIVTIQTAYNLGNPLLPRYIIGLGTRDVMFLEFSSTIIALILAGKVGSNIASEIGTMRVTEQIDALEIMGVNSASYLILPKIVATLLFNPFLSIVSMVVGIIGGGLAGVLTGVVTVQEYLWGIQFSFVPFYIAYSLINMLFFSFIISTVSSFFGYRVRGGSLEVGRASTQAVVASSVWVLVSNLVLTQLILA